MTNHLSEQDASGSQQADAADDYLNIAGPPPLPTKTVVLVALIPTLLIVVLIASGAYAITQVAYRYQEAAAREADRVAAEQAALEQSRREQAALEQAWREQAKIAAARAEERARAEAETAEQRRAELAAEREREQERARERELALQQLKLDQEQMKRSLLRIQQLLLSSSEGQGPDGVFLPIGDRHSLLSWRVHLLPLLGLDSLYRDFHLDEPWDSEHNLTLVSRMPAVFGDDAEGKTRVRTLLRLDGDLETLTRIGDLADGQEQTALLFYVPQASATVWTKPDSGAEFEDYFPVGYSATDLEPSICTLCGSPWIWIEPEMPMELARAIATPAGGELLDEAFLRGRNWHLPEQRHRLGGLAVVDAPASRPVSASDESTEAREKLVAIAAALARRQHAIDDKDLRDEMYGSKLSWRVHLLPYLGHEELYEKFRLNEPWDSKHNLALAKNVPEVFRLGTTHGRTRVMLAFPKGAPTVLDQTLPKTRSVRDASLTIALYLAAPQRSQIWTKRDQGSTIQQTLQQALGWSPTSSILAATMSGDLIEIPPDLHPSKVAAILTGRGKQRFDLQQALGRPAEPLQLIPEIRPADPVTGIVKLAPPSNSYTDLKRRDASNGERELARKLTFGVHAFHEKFGRPPTHMVLPGGTRSGLSWRVHLLPFLNEKLLYEQFKLDEPWDSEHNRKLSAAIPDIFRTASSDRTTSNLRVLSGNGTLFAAEKHWIRAPDGFADTIMFLMVGQALEQEWTKPDTELELVSEELQQICLNADGVRAILGSGEVLAFSRDTPGTIVRSLATANGGELVDAGTVRRWLAYQRGEHWLLPAEETSWEMSQMTRISSALQNFEPAHQRHLPQAAVRNTGSLPLAATQLSWRVHLLPSLGYQTLYRQFRLEEPWDSPHNQRLLPLMPDCYRDATDPPDSQSTRILTFSGPGTAFPEVGLSLSSREISDGTATTICFVQAPPEFAVPWTKPLDLSVNLKQEGPQPVLEEICRIPGMKVALFDGSIRRLAATIDPAGLQALITPAGNEFVKSAELFQHR